ncbi:head-tail joining protein [Paraburkholderia tropica]|uniref:head-tail joining protein n=1 Tax=Paraburkholderia tropica TaxID=92647 RepID=UPI0031CFA53D
MFDPSVFWAAIAAVGMLKTAYVDGIPDGVLVGFASPDQLELDSQVTVAEYQIEYQAEDLPDLARFSILTIDAVRYRVRRPPRRKDDGFFMLADLEVAK